MSDIDVHPWITYVNLGKIVPNIIKSKILIVFESSPPQKKKKKPNNNAHTHKHTHTKNHTTKQPICDEAK